MADAVHTRRAILRAIPSVTAAVSIPACALVVPAAARPTPDERIAAAIAEIDAALTEKYPGQRIQKQVEPLAAQFYKPGGFDLRPRNGEVIAFYTSPEEFGPEDFRWFTHHPR